MRVYLKSILWDSLLCVLASSALAYTVCSAFYATQPFQDAFGACLTAGVCAVVTGVLSLTGYTTRSRVIGSVALGVAILAFLAVGFSASSAESPMADVDGNYLYYSMVACACPVMTYVLSRWKAGCVVLLVGGIVVCALIEYLYWYGHLVAFLVFACAAGALLVYRGYLQSVMNSESERFAFNSVALAGLGVCALALACGVGLFFVVVVPFQPGHVEVKLVTEHYRVDQMEVRGTGANEAIQDETLQSNNTGEDTAKTGDDSGELDGQSDFNDEASDDGASAQSFVNGAVASLALLIRSWLFWVVVGCIIALFVLAVLVKLLLRRRSCNALMSRDSDEAMRGLFLFFLKRFNRFGMVGPGERTLAEYVEDNKGEFEEFERGELGAGRGFCALAETYSKSVYGKCPASESDLEPFKEYRRLFYKRARRYMGRLAYCRMFFFI